MQLHELPFDILLRIAELCGYRDLIAWASCSKAARRLVERDLARAWWYRSAVTFPRKVFGLGGAPKRARADTLYRFAAPARIVLPVEREFGGYHDAAHGREFEPAPGGGPWRSLPASRPPPSQESSGCCV